MSDYEELCLVARLMGIREVATGLTATDPYPVLEINVGVWTGLAKVGEGRYRMNTCPPNVDFAEFRTSIGFWEFEL